MLVADASVLAPMFGDGGRDGDLCRSRLRGESLTAPDLVHPEVLSVWRRQVARGQMTDVQAKAAMRSLLRYPIVAVAAAPLLARAWGHRDNITVYDACYVALAELTDQTLVTGDERLARAPDVRCSIETVKLND